MRTGLVLALAGSICLYPNVARGQRVPADSDFQALAALQQLKEVSPRTRTHAIGRRVTRLYGATMSTGLTAERSAETFRQNHAAVFGVAAQELVPTGGLPGGPPGQPVMYDPVTDTYKFTLFKYAQHQDGLPVFRADLRLLVRNAPGFPMVLAASALRPLKGFAPAANVRDGVRQVDFVAVGFAAAKTQALRGVPDLSNFTVPQVVVWAGLDDMVVEPRVALTFIADNFAPGGQSNEKRLYVADVQTGRILYEESAIIDVDGSAAGMVTTGSGADFCEAEVSTALPHLAVTSGANSTFTDANGDFTVAAGGGTVDATLNDGQWFDVFNFLGSVESLSLPTSTPADFVFNASNATEEVRAQANGYAEANVVRDFAAQFNPTYPTFTDTDIPCWVNRTDGYCPGNAWYDPADGGSPTGYSINFCQSGSGYPNTAWSSVVYHEFGHHLVQAAGSGQGQYGEGMGDVMSVVILDDNRVGLGFFGSCDLAGTLRNADNTLQYPCSGGIHFCGQLLSGCVWDTRNELAVTEPAAYQDVVGDLAVNAMLLHTGSLITPQITIDWLTLDDDDANIGNGTPHYTEICTGFGAHSMDCPPLDVGMTVGPSADFESSGDVGGPFTPNSIIYTVENLGPGSIGYNVTTAATWLTITNGSGSLPNVNDTAQVTLTINAGAALLPQGRHVEAVNFINTTDGLGDTVRNARLNIGIPDDCADAIPVCPGTISDTTVGMTNDGSATCGTSNITPDMWYSYTPGSNGTATFSLCTGTTYDSVLSIHSSCPGTAGNDLGCDDDGCGVGGGPSTVTLGVTADTTYLIRVTGWNGSTGSFTLDVSGPNCSTTPTCSDGILNQGEDRIDCGGPCPPCECTADATCGNGDACDGMESCDAFGQCQPGTALNCDDTNDCTDDSCAPASGCMYAPNTNGCNDGDACTTIDACSNGSCIGGAPLDCDDTNVCTDDSCDPVVGCIYTPNTNGCSDGDACTVGDVCSGDSCESGTTLNCDNGLFCDGEESCDSQLGCQNGTNPCSPVAEWCEETGDACLPHGDGDFDVDGDVDVADFRAFQVCYGQQALGGCEPGNLTGGNGDIDLADFQLFAAALVGPL